MKTYFSSGMSKHTFHQLPVTMQNPSFRIDTFGCKSNRYDSQLLGEMLERAGFCRAGRDDAPDLWILNTCTVTHVADRKARQAIRRKRREAPDSKIFVTGCYAAARKSCISRIEGVDGVYGPKERGQMFGALSSLFNRPCTEAPDPNGGIHDFSGRTRAFVKIQDGCDFFCSYCVVPYVRGAPESRPLESALAEGRRMINAGFREIVLTGIHLGLYGRDLSPQLCLANAVSAFADLDESVRIRISSLEGPEVDGRLLSAMKRPNVCPHLHLPLQSADKGVLKAMGRRYGPDEFYGTMEFIREELNEPAISTDVMVGFPGESDIAFRNTLEFCKTAGFSRLHVFNYSPRPRTAACNLGPRIDSKTAGRRSRALCLLASRLEKDWAQRFVGRTVRVLYEDTTPDGCIRGYSDRYVRVKAPASGIRPGDLRETAIRSRNGIFLRGGGPR